MKRSGFKKKTYAEVLLTRSQRAKTARRATKPKKPKITSLKKKLDAMFSQYIRRKYADENGQVKCYTCPKVAHHKEMQCGHFISRSYLATRFVEDNCRPQCVGCNVFGNGQTVEFARRLELDVGEGTTIRLYKKAQEITKDYPYEEKIKEYTEKLSTLQTPLNDIR